MTDCKICGCGETFKPRRESQRYCSTKCGTRARVTQHRNRVTGSTPIAAQDRPLHGPHGERGGVSDGSTMVWPELPSAGSLNPNGSTPGALQGDDYPLTYDENGYPELPPCLDRRRKPERAALAA